MDDGCHKMLYTFRAWFPKRGKWGWSPPRQGTRSRSWAVTTSRWSQTKHKSNTDGMYYSGTCTKNSPASPHHQFTVYIQPVYRFSDGWTTNQFIAHIQPVPILLRPPPWPNDNPVHGASIYRQYCSCRACFSELRSSSYLLSSKPQHLRSWWCQTASRKTVSIACTSVLHYLWFL